MFAAPALFTAPLGPASSSLRNHDACVVVALLLLFVAPILVYDAAHHWMLWTSLYFARLTYALLSLPFLIFLVPILGTSLHHAKPTAYDQAGLVVPTLRSLYGLVKGIETHYVKD